MENNTNFNKQQFDGLSDLIEMGLGSSAEILSKLLNNEARTGYFRCYKLKISNSCPEFLCKGNSQCSYEY